MAEAAMLHFDAATLRETLDRHALIEALAAMFRAGCESPVRHHHSVSVPGGADATMLLMPAWVPGTYLGTKVANVFPENGALGLAAVQSIYLLFSGRTGELLATFDGAELTTRRTVAASSLAARYLARPDCTTLLIVGTGQVARQIAASHAAVRPIREVAVHGRDPAKVAALVAALGAEGFRASPAEDLASAVAEADIVSCATLSREPLIRGEWLRPGTHVDLIGGFTPQMREADDEVVRRARVFVDTEGALHEAGDIVAPLRTGVLSRADILCDLEGLVRGHHPGRRNDDEVTMFKSVGAALEDLAAAALAVERTHAGGALPGYTHWDGAP